MRYSYWYSISTDSDVSLTEFNDLQTTIELIFSRNNFCGILGNFDFRPKYNANSEELYYMLTTLCSSLSLVKAFDEPTHLCREQLDFIFMHQNFQFPFVAGSYKNMYCKNSSIYLRITSDKDAITRDEIPQPECPINTSSNTPDNHLKIYYCLYCEDRVYTGKGSIMCNACNYWVHDNCLKADEHHHRLRRSTLAKSFVCKICKNDKTETQSTSHTKKSSNKKTKRTKSSDTFNRRNFNGNCPNVNINTRASSSRRNAESVTGLIRLRNQNNSCWLNSIIRPIAYIVNYVNRNADPNLIQLADSQENALVAELRDKLITFIMTKLIPERDILINLSQYNIEYDDDMKSFKFIFSHLVDHPEFDNGEQHDVGEAIHRILPCLPQFQSAEFRYKQHYTCAINGCAIEDETDDHNRRKSLVVTVPARGTFSMREAVNRYFNPEIISFDCPCGSANRYKKEIITQAPTFLLIHLQLFDNRNNKKRSTCELIDHYDLKVNDEYIRYKALFMIEHEGISSKGGHYYSYIKHNNRWIKCNDEHNTIVSPLETKKWQPYFSFFIREDI